MDKISCIIPAYNESKRIGPVLTEATHHPLIDEVVVVDDASKDDTSLVAAGFPGVHLITLKNNVGKSGAIYQGILASKNETLLFLDSDLLGLTQDDLTKLIEPVTSGAADVSISLRKNSPGFWHWIGLDYISGERVFKKELLETYLEKIPMLRGFGLEVFLNSIIIRRKSRIKIVPWPNVESPFPHAKQGKIAGLRQLFTMMSHIFKTVGVIGAGRQIVSMLKQRV